MGDGLRTIREVESFGLKNVNSTVTRSRVNRLVTVSVSLTLTCKLEFGGEGLNWVFVVEADADAPIDAGVRRFDLSHDQGPVGHHHVPVSDLLVFR